MRDGVKVPFDPCPPVRIRAALGVIRHSAPGNSLTVGKGAEYHVR